MNAATRSQMVSELIDELRSWAAERLDPVLIDERRTIPPHIVLGLGNQGLLGMLVPKRWGGLGLDPADAAPVFEALGGIDLCLATFVANHTLATLPIVRDANPELRRMYLPDLAAGRSLAAFALTEPGAGSNLSLIASTARELQPGRFRIRGEKYCIGTACWADVIVTFARHDAGLSAFLLPRESKGLKIGSESLTMGLRGMVQNAICFDDVSACSGQLLGEPFQGQEIAQRSMTLNRLFLASIAIGAMKRALLLARGFAASRRISTGILFENRMIERRFLHHIRRVAILEAALDVAQSQVGNDLAMQMACCAKMLGGEFLFDCVDFAVQVHGGRGYEDTHELARTLRDARAFRIFEGPTEALATYLGSVMNTDGAELPRFIAERCRDKSILEKLTEAQRALESYSSEVIREIGYFHLGEMAAYALAACSAGYAPLATAIHWELDGITAQLARELGEKDLRESVAAALNSYGGDSQPDPLPQWPAWNATEKTYPEAACIHTLFERAVAHHRQAEAVVCGARRLTYEELNAAASSLAEELRENGVGPNSIVAVALPRSADAVVAMIAVLKCGAAYLPLDPALPHSRANFMLAEADVRVMIVSEAADEGPAPHLRRVVIGGRPKLCEFASQGEFDSLAYVIFTSGSTGNPKGAMLPHHGPVNWMLWMRDIFEVTPADAVLWKAVVGFDHSVWECFLPLILGGKLVIAEAGREADWDYLSNLIEAERVTIMQFVPSLLGKFVENTTARQCRTLRHVMSGGEALSPSLVRRFYQTIPHCRLCNAYGPTEASIGVTMFPCTPDIATDFVPIGKPISNIKIHVLDTARRPVAAGQAGEIYIQGGLARGYIHRPRLTAERFVPSLLDPQVTLYKTGDLAAWLPDGNLRFLGRVDNQVKIRGIRIELEEVEAILKQHPAVENAAVAAIGEDASASLWCYYRVRSGESLSKQEAREFLESRLPAYCVPSRLVPVENFALIDSGKIDRRALPALKEINELAGPSERVIACWRRILQVPHVGPNDDFYELGGNSLLILELAAFMKKEFGVIFSDPRILRTVAATLVALDHHHARGSAA